MAYFAFERIMHERNLRKIPLRIGITGTRGKSSVTRLVAAILKEGGWSVLAKTTGSKPALILPDGREKEIRRKGSPSILESRKVLRTAARLSARAAVLELMSIQPESLYVESCKIVRPHVLVVTNVRPDHAAQWGKTRESAASGLASAIPPESTVIIPEKEFFPVFQSTAEKRDSQIRKVSQDAFFEEVSRTGKVLSKEFEENLRLSLAVSDYLKIEENRACRGIFRVKPDFGSLKIWKVEYGRPSRTLFLVSAFAANDPVSTRSVLSKLQKKKLLEKRRVIGILSSRGDRADRSIQWLEALKSEKFPELQSLILVGPHAFVLKRRQKSFPKEEVMAFRDITPEKIMARIKEKEFEGAVIVGIGNMGGFGRDLVEFWEKTGVSYDL